MSETETNTTAASNHDSSDLPAIDTNRPKAGIEATRRFKELMDIHGKRTAEISRKTGLPQATLRYILQGLTDNPRMETMVRLAEYFNVSVDYMVGVKEKDPAIAPEAADTALKAEHVPVLEWKSAAYWVKNTKAALPQGHKKWLPSSENLSKKAFALWTTYEGRGAFPKNCFLIVDPEVEYDVEDYVIAALDKNKPSIKRIWDADGKRYLNPVGGNTPAEVLKKKDTVLGTIVEYRALCK